MASRRHATFALVGVLCLIAAAALFVTTRNDASPAGPAESGTVELWLEERPGTELMRKEYQVSGEASTALGVLMHASEVEKFRVVVEPSSYGKFVAEIMDVKRPEGCYWYFQIDGKEIVVGAETARVPPGGQLHWFLNCGF